MSEYQYYEFQAIDRPLTKEEMAEVRALSTRATITPTRFMNVYNWGDFRGNPSHLVEKYYDAFLYEANWGTRLLTLRLPKQVIDRDSATRYCIEEECVQLREAGDFVIFEFRTPENDDGGDWIEVEDSEAWLPSLLPIRDELANGDLRALYLGWLLCAQSEILDDDLVEPPLPPGLGKLSPALQRLVEFFEIDPDLLEVAAERSAPSALAGPSQDDLMTWVASLPVAEKDALLLRVLDGAGAHLRGELLHQFRLSRAANRVQEPVREEGGRTVANLLATADEHRQAREREEARRKAELEARRAREQAAARAKYLDGLVGQEEQLWQRVENLVEVKRAAEYDQAIETLKDLRDLANRADDLAAYRARLEDLRTRSTRKPSFISRLAEARLIGG